MTADRIVVGIPTATEPIHHMGDVSEPKHMTLCKLGSPEENPDLDMDAINEAVRGVAEGYDAPVTASVEKQGPLGEDGAQVVFVGGDEVNNLHDSLLAAPELREGTGAVQQHPEFIPHVTLGYNLEEPVPDEDLPEQVIFDRLGVWDGDEHTEFPLGPSATSEETAESAEPAGVLMIPEKIPEGAYAELDDGFADELIVAMTRPIGDPLVVSDADTLAIACEQADKLTDEATQMTTRRVLMRRARALGCQHVIPREWAKTTTAAGVTVTVPAPEVAAAQARNGAVPDQFARKTALSTLPDTALRAAYMRGVREFTMTAPQSRPPLPRDVVAQARVNSLIRLAQGDLSARTDDRDLL